jgi:hypothetical protein
MFALVYMAWSVLASVVFSVPEYLEPWIECLWDLFRIRWDIL